MRPTRYAFCTLFAAHSMSAMANPCASLPNTPFHAFICQSPPSPNNDIEPYRLDVYIDDTDIRYYWHEDGTSYLALQTVSELGQVPWLHPTRPILVRIKNDSATPAQLSVGRQGSITEERSAIDGLAGIAAVKDDATPQYTILPSLDRTVLLQPRSAGPWRIHVASVTDDETDKAAKPSHTIEALTVDAFSGALRFGIGVSYVETDRSYEAYTVGAQSYLVEGETSLHPELIVGYSQFFHRRSYVPNARLGFWYRFGLYAGVGVVGGNPENATLPVTVLRSVHAGIEFEFTRHLSLSVVGTARRVKAPLDTASPWAIVDPERLPLRTTAGFGGGLILNFTPAFGRILVGNKLGTQ